jgi:hypothetical protein
METELIVLFILQTAGVAVFGKFEGEAPGWKRALKWLLMLIITIACSHYFGQWVAILVLLIVFTLSLIFHFTWCKRNGIHPFQATPRKKYYQLRQWTLQE